MVRKRNCSRRLVSVATGFQSNCGTHRKRPSSATRKTGRLRRRRGRSGSTLTQFARRCSPTQLRRAWASICRESKAAAMRREQSPRRSLLLRSTSPAPAVGAMGAITVTSATPKRVSARLELTLEDIASVGQQNFESILRENLALALSDELDDQAINGNGTAPNLAGILQRLTDPAAAPTAVAAFDDFVAAFSGGVDGLWANTVKEVAMVAGVETYRLSARTFRDPVTGTAGGRGDMSFADYAMQHFGGWWTNSRMPDPATFLTVDNVQRATLYRMGRSMMGGAGSMRTAGLSALECDRYR